MRSFIVLIAGYKLDKQMRPKAKSNQPAIERRILFVMTGSGIRNTNDTKNPVKIPIAPLISSMRKDSASISFIMVGGFAPRVLMMPKSRFWLAIERTL